MRPDDDRTCLGRRDFLLAGGKLVLLAAVPGLADPVWARRVQDAPLEVARLSALRTGVPLWFDYPHTGYANVLVKLGVTAGGGIGPQRDIVAFSARCTHLGGDLRGALRPAEQMLGPCPRHLTTFDLTRHGVVITGHATQSLPQVILEPDGDKIRAVGMQGLVYGAPSIHG
jgi:arsenite oxidase small subunit